MSNAVVIFSTQAWSDLWVSKHWIADALSKERTVLFVEPPRRIAPQNLIRPNMNESSLHLEKERLYILSTKTLPFPFRIPSAIRPIWRIWLRKQLRQAFDELNFRRFDVINFNPHAFPLIKNFRDRVVRNIYYAVDPPLGQDDAIWPEARVVKESDVVIAVTDRLAKLLSDESGRVGIKVIPHGIDVESAQDLSPSEGKLPPCFKKLRPDSPIIGYTGAIHDIYVDLPLIREAALKRPDYEFVFVGPYSGSTLDKKGSDVNYFSDLSNVHFCGAVKFPELKYAINQFSVCIVPYRADIDNQWARRSPFKILHYFAQGKPVVMSNVPASEDYDGLVQVYYGTDSFISGLDFALYNDCPAAIHKRTRLAEQRSFCNLLKLVEEELSGINQKDDAEKR